MRRALTALAAAGALGVAAPALAHELAEPHEHIAQVTGEGTGGYPGGEDAVDHAGVQGGGHGEAGGHAEKGHGEAHGEGHGAHHGAAPPPPINWFQWHTGKDVLGGELEEGEEPMAPGLLFAILNFLVFAGLLVKFAGPKLATYLRTRHDSIKDQLSEAARLRQEARDKLEEYNRRIAGVDAEVQKLIGEIRAEAEAEKKAILDQARAQADAMKRDAELRIESEIARARQGLEREVVAAAVAAAEKILRERTTAEDQTRLFDSFIDSLGGGGAPRTPPAGGTPASTDDGWTS
ncbi:MAG TPA: F0F1 ATP synthase subunit B [Kofleriaceae bacterium]|nr:F0F1 ATP synthase subunit B [Kofleriaceae bacterium]